MISLTIYSSNLKIQGAKPGTVCACVGLTVPGWRQSFHMTGTELNYSCERDFKEEQGAPRSSSVEFGPLAKSRIDSPAEPAERAGMGFN